MEAFSLLNYWRPGGGGGGGCGVGDTSRPVSPTTTIAAAHHATETDHEDGPFFDLELALPDDDSENNKIPGSERNPNDEVDSDGSDGDEEFDFTLSSNSGEDCSDPTTTRSPSDDLFFQGRLISIEPNLSIEAKSPQFPAYLLKSATKFRVLLLKFKKSRPNTGEVQVAKKRETGQEENAATAATNNRSKLFTVKFKVEEAPIVSLFTRDNSKSQKQRSNEDAASDERKFSREVMQKYLKKVKPLYIRVSRKHGEKVRVSGQGSSDAVKPGEPEKGWSEAEQTTGKSQSQRQGSHIPAGLKLVRKHLGKSRSASSAAVAAAPPVLVSSRRRDDSLLQQQDGIQSAILHCKRSFNRSRDSEASDEKSTEASVKEHK